MALFSSSSGSNSTPRKRSEPTTLSIVASDLEISGHLETQGVVKVEGRVTGNISAGEQVLVAAGAVVEGDIATKEAVIGGIVQGAIEAAERVELLDTAVVTGNVVTARLLIHEGGQVNGEVMMRQGRSGSADGSAAASQPGSVRQVTEAAYRG